MKYAYINGIILNGHQDMKPMKGKVIFTNDKKIEKITESDASIEGYKMIDLQGQYVIPGLINLHVHLPASGKPKKKQSDNRKLVKLLTSNALLIKLTMKMCENYAKTELMSGVTTIRTVGGVLDYDTKIRNKINRGQLIGPRILAANMAISVPGGHMAGSLAYEAKSAQEAGQYVEKIAKDKVDLIKLMITGGILDATVKGEPGVLKMPPEYVKAACDKAHSLNLLVAAHVESTEGLKVALENGVDSIEHGATPDQHILDLFKQNNACLVTTISPVLPYALFDPKISHVSVIEQYNGKVVFEGIVNCAKACLENNIPVGLGTDTGCPYITHYDMWRELYYFHQYCQVSNQFALYTGTLLNAKLGGIDSFTGSIDEGKVADFIVCKNNPLDDLANLRMLSMVVVGGRLLKAPRVKKMADVEIELDKFIK